MSHENHSKNQIINSSPWAEIIERSSLEAMGKIVEVTDGTFKNEIIKSDIPAIVDFWAEWCMPCKMMEPIVREMAKEFKGRIKFGKIDVDENTKTATDMTVMNIPTLVFFKDGKEAGRVTGVVSKRDLHKKIEELFNE